MSLIGKIVFLYMRVIKGEERMSEVEEFCCGKCFYYNGDMRDKDAFCDEREEYVSRKFYCYRYKESEELEGEEE